VDGGDHHVLQPRTRRWNASGPRARCPWAPVRSRARSGAGRHGWTPGSFGSLLPGRRGVPERSWLPEVSLVAEVAGKPLLIRAKKSPKESVARLGFPPVVVRLDVPAFRASARTPYVRAASGSRLLRRDHEVPLSRVQPAHSDRIRRGLLTAARRAGHQSSPRAAYETSVDAGGQRTRDERLRA